MRHRHHRWHGRPPARWLLARGIHRRVVAFLLVSLGLGLIGGAIAHATWSGALPHAAFVCVGLSIFFAMGPLAWMAAFRIAWPLRELATVAGELRAGRLDSREELTGGDLEVGEVSLALREMADRVARQLRDQRALMAAVSHELRSPLGRARVLVELAREGTGGPEAFDELQAEIDQVDGLVGDLLAGARIDFEAVNPQRLSARALGARALEAAGLETLVVAPGVESVMADPTLAARALLGLLENARRYGGDQIVLRVEPAGERVRFVVEDDGPGFAPGDEERSFEPFWRGPGAGVPGGSGLGLALVRRIAEAHGGVAGAANREEGGARVWLELPAG